MPNRIVVLGSSFAGLTAAVEVRRRLGGHHEVTVISSQDTFTFLPSLIWVPFGLRREEDISFPLRPLFEREHIEFVHARATRIDVAKREVVTAQKTVPYDVLVVATGPKPVWDAVPGLGPDGFTQSIWSYKEAQKAQVAWERFLVEPGDLIVGGVAGASGISAAYEFAFNAIHQLGKKGPSGWRQITFVTPEPYVGHLGVDGIGTSCELIERKLLDARVELVTNARVERVEEGRLMLESGRTIGFSFAMLAPPAIGADVVRGCPEIADERGFVRTDAYLRVPGHPEIFAAGAALSAGPMSEAVEAPRTGYQAERSGKLVAENVTATVMGLPLAPFDAKENNKLILDAGDGGFLLSAKNLDAARENAWVVPGIEAHWAKVALEEYFLATRKRGVAL